MTAELNIQAAIHAALVGDAALMALVEGVYDAVPQASDSGNGAEFPYVVIGDDTHIPFDTDTSVGADTTLTIHVWSRYEGRKQVKEIQGVIYDVLHRQSIPITGFHLVGIDWLGSESFTDSDGLTRHGVQTFRITVEES